MLGRLIVVASTTLTFVASCGAPKDTSRQPEIGRPLVIDRIGPDPYETLEILRSDGMDTRNLDQR